MDSPFIYTLIAGYGLHWLAGTRWFAPLSTLNMSLRTLAAVLMLPRYVWKYFRPSQPYPPDMSRFERGIAQLAHEVFYLAIFVMLGSGFLIASRDWYLFGLLPVPDRVFALAVGALFNGVHIWACRVVAALLLLHLAAVLKHYLIDERNLLRRML